MNKRIKTTKRKTTVFIILFTLISQLFSPLFLVTARAVRAGERELVSSTSNMNAKIIIQEYLDSHHGYSKKKLIEALIEEDFTAEKALVAVEEAKIDYSQEAVFAAERLVPQTYPFNQSKIIEKLVGEGFVQADAKSAYQRLDLEKLALDEARSFFRYGGIPSKSELTSYLQDFGYQKEIAERVANQVHREYEIERKFVLEWSERLLKQAYYSREKLLEEVASKKDFVYYSVLSTTVDALGIDWKQQALAQAEEFLSLNPGLSRAELSMKLADEWFQKEEIDYALKNSVKVISLAEASQAVSELELVKNKENLELAEYYVGQLADSSEKSNLLKRLNRVKDDRKKRALEQAEGLLTEAFHSRSYLIESLEYYGFTEEEAIYAADETGTVWKEEAFKQVSDYLEANPDSKKGSLDYLVYARGFTEAEAIYAANKTKTDWKEQALRSAKELLYFRAYSETELKVELKSFGFKESEAQYASKKALNLDSKEPVEQKKLVTVLNLNLRSRDSDIASPTVYIPEGRQVEYLGQTDNGWFKLRYQGKVGYTHRGNLTSLENYESEEKPKIHDTKLVEPANNQEFIVVMDMNLRTKDADRYRSIALMPEGAKVTHLGTTANGWFKVRYDDQLGYVHRGHVTSVKNYYSKDREIHSVKLTEPASNKEFVSIIDQNLRTGNISQYRSIILIPRGHSVNHLGTTANGWFKVDYLGIEGYIYRGDLTSRENYNKLHD